VSTSRFANRFPLATIGVPVISDSLAAGLLGAGDTDHSSSTALAYIQSGCVLFAFLSALFTFATILMVLVPGVFPCAMKRGIRGTNEAAWLLSGRS